MSSKLHDLSKDAVLEPIETGLGRELAAVRAEKGRTKSRKS